MHRNLKNNLVLTHAISYILYDIIKEIGNRKKEKKKWGQGEPEKEGKEKEGNKETRREEIKGRTRKQKEKKERRKKG